jgi:4-hydroxybenzoate polyprenyltransferase
MIAAISGTKKFLSLVKFSHTIFALPFAIIGFMLGTAVLEQPFSPKLFGLMLLCMVFARSAAMGFNRYIDREFDARNARTAIREIPAGVISPTAALLFVIISSVLFVATTWFINPLCFYLSPVALLVVLGYSYTKRFTWLCHVVLGIGLSLAPIGAYLAVTGVFNLLPLLFSFTVLFWVSGFDIIYSLQDEEFDSANNLYSIPSFLGKKNALLVSRFLHLASISFVIAAGIIGHFGFIYWIGAAFFLSMLIYQHSLVKPTDLSRVNLAFATTNGIASVVFGCFVVADILLWGNI